MQSLPCKFFSRGSQKAKPVGQCGREEARERGEGERERERERERGERREERGERREERGERRDQRKRQRGGRAFVESRRVRHSALLLVRAGTLR